MGKGVITTPDDKLQPLLWNWDGLLKLKGNTLHHATLKGELLSSRKQTEKNKSLIPRPQLLSIKEKVNTRVCSIFQIQLSLKNIVLQDQPPCIRAFESCCNFGFSLLQKQYVEAKLVLSGQRPHADHTAQKSPCVFHVPCGHHKKHKHLSDITSSLKWCLPRGSDMGNFNFSSCRALCCII